MQLEQEGQLLDRGQLESTPAVIRRQVNLTPHTLGPAQVLVVGKDLVVTTLSS